MWQLTILGGLAFWAASIATSLLPIAAEYRAAYSNWSPQTVWVAALPVGLIIGGGVSYCLLRWFGAIPTRGPIRKAVMLSFVALVVATVLIDVPRSIHGSIDPWHYFLIGLAFNAARFLVLGLAIGYVYRRLDKPAAQASPYSKEICNEY